MRTNGKYSLDGGAITEMICSVLAVSLIFISWLDVRVEAFSAVKSFPTVFELLKDSEGPGV